MKLSGFSPQPPFNLNIHVNKLIFKYFITTPVLAKLESKINEENYRQS